MAEQKLWSRLRDRQLEEHKFRRQVPRGPFVVDFACLDRKLVVELDGGQHAEPVQSEGDRKRSAWLEAQGYRVLRFWNNEVHENMDGVLTRIVEVLKDRKSPHPNPLQQLKAPRPSGEREGPAKREGEGAAVLQMRIKPISKRKTTTNAELRLWSAIRRRQLDGLRFRRQVPLGAFIVDFACYDARLVIELDGGQHSERHREDAGRTAWLESRGFRVLRFWNNEVLEDMDGVIARILEVLKED